MKNCDETRLAFEYIPQNAHLNYPLFLVMFELESLVIRISDSGKIKKLKLKYKLSKKKLDSRPRNSEHSALVCEFAATGSCL